MSYIRFGLMIPHFHSGDVYPDVSQHLCLGARLLLGDAHLHGDHDGRDDGGHHARLHARHVFQQALNIAIFVGIRSSCSRCRSGLSAARSPSAGPSYMRAMIPHHSIAIMTSERAQIRDPRVRQACRRDHRGAAARDCRDALPDRRRSSEGNVVESIYQDPPAEPGSVEDALSNTLISTLDLAPMPEAEADRVLEDGAPCTFNRSPEADPILWASEGVTAAMKLNGVLVALDAGGDPQKGDASLDVLGAGNHSHRAAARRRGRLAPERGARVRAR
jgi:hypothetical protein